MSCSVGSIVIEKSHAWGRRVLSMLVFTRDDAVDEWPEF